MKSIGSALFLLALAAGPALGALPPQYQRQAEFIAVLEAATEAFGVSQSIESVEFVETDLYQVHAGECTLNVKIVDTASAGTGMMAVGPRQFEAQPEEIICP